MVRTQMEARDAHFWQT